MNVSIFGAFSRTACLSSTLNRSFSTSSQSMYFPTSTTDTLDEGKGEKKIGVVKGTALAVSTLTSDTGFFGCCTNEGEPKKSHDIIEKASDRAFDRMVDDAMNQGADGIIAVKMLVNSLNESAGTALNAHPCAATVISFYGTAVKTTEE
ncbi:MAG: heavy metal-binding domain-containing protein [Chlamydiota bacterium]